MDLGENRSLNPFTYQASGKVAFRLVDDIEVDNGADAAQASTIKARVYPSRAERTRK